MTMLQKVIILYQPVEPHNYFNINKQIIFKSDSVKFLDISTKLFFACNCHFIDLFLILCFNSLKADWM